MSVCLSACISAAVSGRISVKFYCWGLLWRSVEKVQSRLKPHKYIGHFIWILGDVLSVTRIRHKTYLFNAHYFHVFDNVSSFAKVPQRVVIRTLSVLFQVSRPTFHIYLSRVLTCINCNWNWKYRHLRNESPQMYLYNRHISACWSIRLSKYSCGYAGNHDASLIFFNII